MSSGCGWDDQLFHTYLAPLVHAVTACSCAEIPDVKLVVCVSTLIGLCARLLALSVSHRRSLGLTEASQKHTQRQTHAPGSPPVVNSTTSRCSSPPVASVRFSWLCASTLTPRSSSVHCHNHRYHFWVHCSG